MGPEAVSGLLGKKAWSVNDMPGTWVWGLQESLCTWQWALGHATGWGHGQQWGQSLLCTRVFFRATVLQVFKLRTEGSWGRAKTLRSYSGRITSPSISIGILPYNRFAEIWPEFPKAHFHLEKADMLFHRLRCCQKALLQVKKPQWGKGTVTPLVIRSISHQPRGPLPFPVYTHLCEEGSGTVWMKAWQRGWQE